MAYTPLMDQTNLQQSFSPQVIYATNWLSNYVITQNFLAPATNGISYAPGVVMAQYTSGPNAGLVVNWKESASDGQGTAIGVLVDNYIDPTASANPPQGYAVSVLNIGRVYGDPLQVPVGDTLVTALTQLQAVEFQTPNLSVAYDLRGPVVS